LTLVQHFADGMPGRAVSNHHYQAVEPAVDRATGLLYPPIPQFQIAAILRLPIWSDVIEQIHDPIVLAIFIVGIIQMGI
jgi:hypothetical protein